MVVAILVAPDKFFSWLWRLIWTTVSVGVGIGLGFGLALHVYNQLQSLQRVHEDKKRKSLADSTLAQQSAVPPSPQKRRSLFRDASSSVMSASAYHHYMNSATSFLEDGNSYFSMMAQAGYPIVNRVLRGQVLRKDHFFFNTTYQFTDTQIANQQAVQLMTDEFPALPEPVRRQLGRFIEHVMRDYISSWYSSLDRGVLYRPEASKREEGIPRDGGDTSGGTAVFNELNVSSSAVVSTPDKTRHTSSSVVGSIDKDVSTCATQTLEADNTLSQDPSHVAAARRMVFSTLTHRRAPMIDCTYRVIAAAFGNLATRAEHVNVLQLVLLKWTQVVGHTFKMYRTMRKLAQEKNASRIVDRAPNETEITREYLLAGKLHEALTFGMDVPSLLFADASGEEFGCGTDATPTDPTQVLEQRLYNTNISKECELDYNRVVASRLIRALLPKTESNSQCVMALVTEIFASCVFQPLMNLWVPSFLNDIIVKSFVSAQASNEGVAGISESVTTQETELVTEALEIMTEDETNEENDLEHETPEIVYESDEVDEEINEPLVDSQPFQKDRSVSMGSAEDTDLLSEDGEAAYANTNSSSLREPGDEQSAEMKDGHAGSDGGASSDVLTRDLSDFGTATPRYLDFQRNGPFAASLRAEHKRRNRAWEARPADKTVVTVLRKTATRSIDYDLHAELHALVRIFSNGTNELSILDAARKNSAENEDTKAGKGKIGLLTFETVAGRRRIEVPDDDSSFLLRAQARKVNPLSVHRDDRNHEQSFQRFQATYEEPAVAPGSTRYNGGKFLRYCAMEYYPSNRTAAIDTKSDTRKLDKRKGKRIGDESVPMDQNATCYLSASFLREKHLCQKGSQKTSQSFLSSSIMEPTDFNSAPRSGRALDFVFRMSLFERPVVDLAGKRFTIQDPSHRGVHRADSSSLEISDASISFMLLHAGRDWIQRESSDNSVRHKVEMGPDGYPMMFFRMTTKVGERVNTEIKPYRVSFIRAALMVTSSRQEAQNQSLIECIKAGSAKSATKMRAEEHLRPTLKLLEFANDKSKDQTKASCLVRDLKLGIYHIDKQQLRRNGILSLRHPTTITQLSAEVDGTALAKDVPLAKLTDDSLLHDETLYRIRCTAVIELVDCDDSMSELEPYALDDGSLVTTYREEWIVYRSMKDFQTLHKQLKAQVNPQESTMSTGTRIVGAATAALSSRSTGRRYKKVLIPSLAQAGMIGGLGVTKRSIEKRKELLDEYIGYLLSSNSLMNRCSELLLFLGASHPFPQEVTVTKTPANFMDPFGRMSFVRSVALREGGEVAKLRRKFTPRKPTTNRRVPFRKGSKARRNAIERSTVSVEEGRMDPFNMDPATASKVEQIPLAEVRNHIVELMRCSFGFENASFVRSQMLAALETASFVAIAKQSNFRRMLYNVHTTKLNGEALGGSIQMLLDLLWPDGVWMTPKPLLTEEEEALLKEDSRLKLQECFPDSLRTILGKELTKDGLDMIHEMLQNRLVVKSMFYMLFDLVWIEILPELRDSLPCASALDLDLL